MKPISLFFVLMILFPAFGQDRNTELDRRLKNSIFLEVAVNKTKCYIGEPIIATYKLYSSVEAVSQVVKNPAFSGFQVRDLVRPADKSKGREIIDGVNFDVHIIRKLQLTPVEQGVLRLDPLVMSNKIRLVDSQGNKISLLNGIAGDFSSQNGNYGLNISSVPIDVEVLPAPASSKVPTYEGATGSFSMNIRVSKDRFQPDEEGMLTITVVGKGNFDQVALPQIEWPAGIKVFPAKTGGNYTKGDSNSSGYKVFGIVFTGSKPGAYTLMPVKFSYFDENMRRFNTITYKPLTFYIDEPTSAAQTGIDHVLGNDQNRIALLAGAAVVAGLLLILLLIRRKKERPVRRRVSSVNETPLPAKPGVQPVENYLKSATDSLHQKGNLFFNQLKQGVIHFFEDRYELPAALFNRSSLQKVMNDDGRNSGLQQDVLNLLTEIEMNIYSGGGLDANRARLLDKTTQLLRQLQ